MIIIFIVFIDSFFIMEKLYKKFVFNLIECICIHYYFTMKKILDAFFDLLEVFEHASYFFK